ncbi:MAG: sugar ABC transporter permease [Defluviitaleaceae bacterium]|nr:sugar ABC transporter permease [Defluviitaleaceae bacterium]
MVKSKSKPQKRGMTMAGKNAVSGYLFILPFVLGFIAFMAYPLYQTVRMAFSDVNLDLVNHGYTWEWVGIENFRYAFTINADFLENLVTELLGMAMLVPAVLVFSLFVSILLNRKFVGRGFVRAVFFLPVILASGVLVGIETNNSLLEMVATQIQEQNAARAGITGVIEGMMENLVGGAGIGDFFQYVLDIINQIYSIAMASGIQILIFLAGLQTINPSIFEAASIEGATGWENFWKITFPMISPMILVVVVYSVIDFLVRTDGEIMDMVHRLVTQFNAHGLGSAMALSYFAIIALILAILGFGISRLVYYYD